MPKSKLFRYHNAQECGEESLGEYLTYWKGDRKEGSRYLKDWHFHRMVRHIYTAYSTPPFFSSDWLNEWWEGGKGKGEETGDKNLDRTMNEGGNDYRFLYIGPRGS